MAVHNQHIANAERTVYAPLGALQALVRGARNQSEEERELERRVAEQRQRIQVLRAKMGDIDHTLSQYKMDHFQSKLTASPSSPPPQEAARLPVRSLSQAPPSPVQRPLQPTGDVNHLLVADNNLQPAAARVRIQRERVTQLEEVMSSVKEISAQGEFEEVIARTLGAAQRLVRADKYTLGLLNERRNVVEIFSAGPWRRHQAVSTGPPESIVTMQATAPSSSTRQRVFSTFGIAPSPSTAKSDNAARALYVAEGFVAADSATTFGRVIITGKPLHIEDFYTYETYADQIKRGNNGGASPRALLCLPICNAHSAIVGVLQVVSMNGTTPPPRVPTTPTKDVFVDTDTRSLEFLAVVAGAAIWNLILFRERQTAQSRIEGLLKLHRNISMEAVSSTVLDQVLSVCHELIGTERIGLFMKVEGESEDELYIACAADIVRGEYMPITKGIVGHVARTGETVITNDAYSHAMFDPTLDHKTGFVTKRILCLPVKSPDGHILAVVSAVNKIDNTDFSREDAVFLNYAADAVGISLHKASLHHEVKTAHKLIEARLQLTTFLAESTDIERFVDLVMDVGKDIMECDRFGFLLIDHFKKELWITPRVVSGGAASGSESAGIRTPMNRGISGLVATTGQPVWTRDAYKHELFDPNVDLQTGYRTTSVLCMPVMEDHATLTVTPKVVAVAMCINKKEGSHVVAFTKTDRDVMEKFCREVQFALGRLSLDISYYKVVYDCATVVADGFIDGDTAAAVGGTTGRLDGLSEPDIISSIVHKYCHSNATNNANDSAKEPLSLAAVVPSLLKKKQEDDAIPFPREIVFAGGVDDPLDQWDTDTLAISTSSEIAVACGAVFRAYGFLETFRIAPETFAAFTTNVANYYRSNPFHNFHHALQVLLTMHSIVRRECRKFFSGVEIFAMLLAALCHDIDHPGNSNDFELRTLSPMALTHNDDAVLERHHCRVTFIILNHKSAKILQHLDDARYKRVRQMIISCILATDMAKHFDKCKALESLTRRQLSEKKQLLMGILMHAADLSHQALPFRQASDWGARLLDEFQAQAKAEHDLGVATDVFMQHLESRKHRLVVQLNLINYVARPIWLPLSSLCHQLRFYADELERNFEIFQTQLEECRRAEKTASDGAATSCSTTAAAPTPPLRSFLSTASGTPGDGRRRSTGSAAAAGLSPQGSPHANSPAMATARHR